MKKTDQKINYKIFNFQLLDYIYLYNVNIYTLMTQNK